MNEEFLHYIWKYQLFDHKELVTTDGEKVEISKAGIHNFDSGPDFFNAQVRIAETLWAGHVEIHGKSSEWYAHKHDTDAAYDQIILHVVHEDDRPVHRSNGMKIPTVVLKGRFELKLLDNYRDLTESMQWVPCSHQIHSVPDFVRENWLDRVLVDRLERKATKINAWLSMNNNDWEQTFYQALARNFGFRVNAVPFELLATSLPYVQLSKHRDSLFQLEAMLYGQAGLLSGKKFMDDYPKKLQKEYEFLASKFRFKPIEAHLWKFMRMRPANFPSIRISQFASLLHQSKNIFSESMEESNIQKLRSKFQLKASEYWRDRYRFDKKTTKVGDKKMSEASSNNILINTVAPFLFVYGRKIGEEKMLNRSFDLLHFCKGEVNKITKAWSSMGMPTKTSFQTQALIQLKNEFCDNKKCLNCAIGNHIIKS